MLENFNEYIGEIPAHSVRAIEDENAAATYGLKVGGTLNGAQLADTQHGAGHRALQANGIGDDGPDVRVRLQNQRNALDGSGVGTFATFDETLLEKRLRIGELGDALASGALAAEVVREDRKSTRLNSSHQIISYAVFCLKKKKVSTA